MKKFLLVFLLLINLFFQGSCVSLKDFEKSADLSPTLSAVIDSGYNSALYKASIDFSKKHFSGLFYFKALKDSSYRIILLTQTGLNLLDLKYKNNLFETINCKDFINRKIILNTLKNDINLLISNDNNYKRAKHYKNKKDLTYLVKTRKRSKSTYYFYNQNNDLCRIIQTKYLKHVNIGLVIHNKLIPKEIEIIHKRINLKIKLNLVEQK